MLDVDETIERLATSTDSGLAPEEADRRLIAHGPNTLPEPPRPTTWTRLLREFRSPMAVLLLVAAFVSGWLLSEVIDAFVIAAIVVLNATIGAVQEGKAANALESLRTLETESAVVKRGGGWHRVPSADIVVGDVVGLQAGDLVPADLRVIEEHGLETDESILTGESLPAAKTVASMESAGALGDRHNLAFSGTFVARGTATGVVIATGADTAIGQIAGALASQPSPTPLQRELGRLTRLLGAGAIVISIIVLGFFLATTPGATPEEAFLVAVALAVAAVPEGLPTVVTVGLALGVRRMAVRGAIVRRLPAVETLGSATVLLTDKTGTLTENRLAVDLAVTASGSEPTDAWLTERIRRALLSCNDASTPGVEHDAVDEALYEWAARDRTSSPVAEPVALVPFDSDRRRMTVEIDDDGDRTVISKGAPEEIVNRCSTLALADHASAPMNAPAIQALTRQVDDWAASGVKVIAVAEGRLAPDSDLHDERDLELLALVGLRDPLRATAPGAVAAARAAGIDVVMVTGDHPGTAGAIAAAAGIRSTPVVVGTELARRSGDDAAVYARVDPGQKLALVEAAQDRGAVVAVTGDGVNDAPALRKADIGVAMGRRGSDVAKAAADLVIVDDDLSTIVAAIREGRGVYDNVRRVVDYLVAGNLSEVMVVLAGLALAGGAPLTAVQLLWINLLTDGLPALALGVEPVSAEVMQRKPRPRNQRLLDAPHIRSLTGRAAVLAGGPILAMMVAAGNGAGPDLARTVLFSSLVVAHLLYASAVGSGAPNRWRTAAVATALALQAIVLFVPAVAPVFDLVTPDLGTTALILAAGAIPAGLLAVWLRSRPGRSDPVTVR